MEMQNQIFWTKFVCPMQNIDKKWEKIKIVFFRENYTEMLSNELCAKNVYKNTMTMVEYIIKLKNIYKRMSFLWKNANILLIFLFPL